MLLVVPRGSAGGRAFALDRGAVLEHSEHALVLLDAPVDGPSDPAITLRPATSDDVGDLARLLSAGFGGAPSDVARASASELPGTLVIGTGGVTIGTVRLTRDRGGGGGVYGFVVDPGWRGRGVGEDVLRRVCQRLRAQGASRVGLEVAPDNEGALGLYTSLGFLPVATEDYYALSDA